MIDTLHHACAVLVYRDESGQTQRLQVSADELRTYGTRLQAARARDAGADR